jgi:mono/diheme cytochrome c family protein
VEAEVVPRQTICFLLFSAFGTLLASGCEGQGGSAFADDVARGEALYDTNCKACHEDATLQLRKKPPDLKGLFQKQTLPSGAPATDEQVRKTVQEGRGIMPPFAHALNKSDVEDLLKYLHNKQ